MGVGKANPLRPRSATPREEILGRLRAALARPQLPFPPRTTPPLSAETRMQEFNEQQNIFARYLPYAIVFGCVEKWAKAFESIEAQAAASTAGWYAGMTPFHAVAFSQAQAGQRAGQRRRAFVDLTEGQ